jgi:hypothetical protein
VVEVHLQVATDRCEDRHLVDFEVRRVVVGSEGLDGTKNILNDHGIHAHQVHQGVAEPHPHTRAHPQDRHHGVAAPLVEVHLADVDGRLVTAATAATAAVEAELGRQADLDMVGDDNQTLFTYPIKQAWVFCVIRPRLSGRRVPMSRENCKVCTNTTRELALEASTAVTPLEKLLRTT